MIAPLYNKFSQEFKDVRTPSSQLSASPCRKLRLLFGVLLTFFLQQVKFYRVDIDEDNIAATVAEAGVASVVLPLLRLVAVLSGTSKRDTSHLAAMIAYCPQYHIPPCELSPGHAVLVSASYMLLLRSKCHIPQRREARGSILRRRPQPAASAAGGAVRVSLRYQGAV